MVTEKNTQNKMENLIMATRDQLLKMLNSKLNVFRINAIKMLGWEFGSDNEIVNDELAEAVYNVARDDFNRIDTDHFSKEDHSWKKQLPKKLREQIHERLVELSEAKFKNNETRVSAIRWLVALEVKEHVKDVVPLLYDEDEKVRKAAAEYVAKFGGNEYKERLFEFIRKKDLGVIECILSDLIGETTTKEDFREIIANLKDVKDENKYYIQGQIKRAIEEFGYKYFPGLKELDELQEEESYLIYLKKLKIILADVVEEEPVDKQLVFLKKIYDLIKQIPPDKPQLLPLSTMTEIARKNSILRTGAYFRKLFYKVPSGSGEEFIGLTPAAISRLRAGGFIKDEKQNENKKGEQNG